jgi:hypothetical protein
MKMIEPGILFFVNAFVFDRGLTARVQPANFSHLRDQRPVPDSGFYLLD